MPSKPTYEEPEQRVKELEKETAKRKQAEEALQESQKRYKELWDDAPVAYHMLDPRGIIKQVNQTEIDMLGYTRDEMVGKPIFDFILPEQRKEAEERFRLKLAGQNVPKKHDRLYVKKDGSKMYVSIDDVLEYDSDGKLIGVRTTMVDVSQEMRAEEALRTAHAELEKRVEERTAELVRANEQLKREIEERKRAVEESLRQSALMEAVNRIFRETLICETNEEVARTCLRVAEELTGSKFGWIGELNRVGRMDTIALSNPGWDLCRIPKSDSVLMIRNMEVRGIWGSVLKDERSQIVNDPTSHPDRVGFPEGHPPVTSFMGTPLKHADRTIGMMALANKESGYDLADQQDVESLSIAFVEALNRKRAEEAIFRAKEDWENTFDAITDMVMLLDNEQRIIRVNKATAEALNTTKEDLVGKKCYDAVHGKNRPTRRCSLVETVKKLGPHTTEMVEPSLGGTFICSTSPILNREGKLTGYTHTLKDVTESKRLEAQLEQSRKLEAIGTLAGGVAHDFNNLLMGVQGNVSLMLIDMDYTHPYYERLKNIEKQVQSGAMLTSHLLGYARKGKYEVKPLDLNQLVRETSDAFGRTRKQITIHRELAKDLFAIEADLAQTEQVLWNLLVNAADAMPRGGDLILKTTNATHKDMKGKLYDPKPGNYVLLTVTDMGTGMDKKTMERIFDPFFTTKEMGRGTGLGLASAYGIIKAHAGYIDVESKTGHGTTFSVYLPASQKKVRKTVEKVETAERFIKETGTALLVDDEEVILEVGKDLLETMGYQVLTADNGQEAVEVYRKNCDVIDIVILDMVMPNMGGGEAYDRMKETNPEIKVLLSSGYSIDGEASEILERGCNGFIQKPFTIRELSGKVSEILDKE